MVLFAAGFAAAQPVESEINPTSVFDRPGLADRQREITALLQIGRHDEARARLEPLLNAHPDVESLHFTQGLVFLVSGDSEASIDAFETAWKMGDRQLRKLTTSAQLEALFEDPRIAALLADVDPELTPPEPADAIDGIAEVTAGNTVWDSARDRLVSRVTLPDRLRSKPVMKGNSPTARKLRSLLRKGRSAGLAGVLYDNRDRGHGRMRLGKFPQIASVAYSEAAQARSLDYGLNTEIFLDAITIGNSSTALVGKQWRSQGRFGLTQPSYPTKLYQSYRANQIYLFPEHRDHDPVREGGQGDVYPANTPYMLFSQGSSRSELRMLDAVAVILAALPPGTRSKLQQEGLLAPMVQQIFRHGQSGILTTEDYLSPRAHPSVFDADASELERMIDLAQEIEPEDIPPIVLLNVISEAQNVSPFAKGVSEHLFTTPSAIARVHRSLDQTRKMEIGAEATRDPNGRALSFRWVLLRGDPSKVRIVPKGKNESIADVEIDWHDRFEELGIEAQRVDIGVFAFNGVHWSAPAFLSVSFPPNQRRDYDAEGRLVEIDYRDPSLETRYADPLLFVDRDWRDRFGFDAQGRRIGWTRTRSGVETQFTRHGLKIIERDAIGRPLIAEFVDYSLERSDSGNPRSVEIALGQRAEYRYKSDQETLGEPILIQTGQ
ncbi:MAG: hypothetical protein AAGC81_10740 [Pseudomonadota bacterium]